jgi:hypothetical protein
MQSEEAQQPSLPQQPSQQRLKLKKPELMRALLAIAINVQAKLA